MRAALKSLIAWLINVLEDLDGNDKYYIDFNLYNDIILKSERLKQENKLLKTESKSLLNQVSELQASSKILTMTLDELSKELDLKLEGCSCETKEAEKWNSNWKRGKVIYKAREDSIRFDVRNFITFPDSLLKQIVEKEKLVGDNDDETALNCLKYVIKNVRYVGDNEQYGFNEQWDFPAEVINRRKADCEGGANLLISLMRAAGVPAYKVKNMCGSVPGGGHSCAIYLDEERQEWVDLDWCYLPNTLKINQRAIAKDMKYQGKTKWQRIWFTFNDKYAWTNNDLEIKPGERK